MSWSYSIAASLHRVAMLLLGSNERGRALAASRAISRDPPDKYAGVTLGAYRRGKNMPWCPGARIPVWVACASMDQVTGVPWPHCYFIQDSLDGGLHCPACAEERARGVPRSQWREPGPQGELPF